MWDGVINWHIENDSSTIISWKFCRISHTFLGDSVKLVFFIQFKVFNNFFLLPDINYFDIRGLVWKIPKNKPSENKCEINSRTKFMFLFCESALRLAYIFGTKVWKSRGISTRRFWRRSAFSKAHLELIRAITFERASILDLQIAALPRVAYVLADHPFPKASSGFRKELFTYPIYGQVPFYYCLTQLW